MAGDALHILSGFMKGKNKRRQEDLQLEQLKLQTQSKLSSEKIALEKEKRAMAKDAQEQKLMDMFLQRFQGGQGEESPLPGATETTPMGESFQNTGEPSLLDSLSRGQMNETFNPVLPEVESMLGQQPQVSPTSKMSPIDMALMKKFTGIDMLGAGGLDQRIASAKRVGDQGDERIALTRAGQAQNQDQFNQTRNDRNAEVNYQNVPSIDGGTMRQGFDRFGKPVEGSSFMGELPPVESREVDLPDGGKGTQLFNKRTNEPASSIVPTKHPPMPAAETASKVTLAVEAEKIMPKFKALLWKNGKLDRDVVAQMALPFGGVGKGRTAKSMFMDALDARIRAATGAAVTKEEWPAYYRMYLPQILDSEDLAKDKIKRLENFMSSYLETLDPKGIIRDRVNSSKDVDFVFNPATGKLEPAK